MKILNIIKIPLIFLKKIFDNYFRSNYQFKRTKVLARVACLGREVIEHLGIESGMINHQKSRVDYLNLITKKKDYLCKPKQVRLFLDRPYIYSCICQQEYDFFSYKKPAYIFMDSFSGLTDQKFVNKQTGWMFFSNYLDVRHDDNFKRLFNEEGLLDCEKIEEYYSAFFEKLNQCYQDVPVIFLHFPTTLDSRQKFKTRADAIYLAISRLSDKYSNLFHFKVEDKDVRHSVNKDGSIDEFPYHYHQLTYAKFVEMIRSEGIMK